MKSIEHAVIKLQQYEREGMIQKGLSLLTSMHSAGVAKQLLIDSKLSHTYLTSMMRDICHDHIVKSVKLLYGLSDVTNLEKFVYLHVLVKRHLFHGLHDTQNQLLDKAINYHKKVIIEKLKRRLFCEGGTSVYCYMSDTTPNQALYIKRNSNNSTIEYGRITDISKVISQQTMSLDKVCCHFKVNKSANKLTVIKTKAQKVDEQYNLPAEFNSILTLCDSPLKTTLSSFKVFDSDHNYLNISDVAKTSIKHFLNPSIGAA